AVFHDSPCPARRLGEGQRFDLIDPPRGNGRYIDVEDFVRRLASPDARRIDVCQLSQSRLLPPRWYQPHRRFDQLHLPMPRKPEADEPLAVQRPDHLLQNTDAPRVILDQVVVGGEDGGDLDLGSDRRDTDFDFSNSGRGGMSNLDSTGAGPNLRPDCSGVE